MLRSEGKTVVDLREQTTTRQKVGAKLPKVQADHVLFFTNQLAVMVDTGVPLTEALDCIVEQTDHAGAKAMVSTIADQVKGGVEFSAALARYPKAFDKVYISMVQASEISGTMGHMLERLAEHLRNQREMRKQVQGAMLYPTGMLIFAVGIVIAMMVFVLPRFQGIYAGKGAVLPKPTRALLATSDFLVNHWFWLLIGTAAVVAGAIAFLRTPTGRYHADRARLKLPAIGKLYEKVYISRSFRTLATMLSSGVDVLDGMRIAAGVAGNRLYRDMWLRVADGLKQGRTLSEEMFSTSLIPRGVAQMVASGDKTGRLASVMERIADFCESDLKIGIKAMTSMIEPVMIVIMGLIVGGIAMALLLPIFSISKVVAN